MLKYRLISKETSDRFPRTKLKKDDFIFSVRGTMGKVAIIPKKFENANITANLMRISPNRNIIFPKFLLYEFFTHYFVRILNSLSPQTTIKTIQSRDLKSINLIIPTIKEQTKIASILSGVDAPGCACLIIATILRMRLGILLILFAAVLNHEFHNPEKDLHNRHNS